jgi:hypothetical protein
LIRLLRQALGEAVTRVSGLTPCSRNASTILAAPAVTGEHAACHATPFLGALDWFGDCDMAVDCLRPVGSKLP